MTHKEFKSSNPYGFSNEEHWHLDEIITNFTQARSPKAKKQVELQCYKQFKWMGFKPSYIEYLNENDCRELANEMSHFSTVYNKIPHEHEKRKAA